MSCRELIAILIPMHSPMLKGGLCRQGRQEIIKDALHRAGLGD